LPKKTLFELPLIAVVKLGAVYDPTINSCKTKTLFSNNRGFVSKTGLLGIIDIPLTVIPLENCMLFFALSDRIIGDLMTNWCPLKNKHSSDNPITGFLR